MSAIPVSLANRIGRFSLASISVIASISLSQAAILSTVNVDPCIGTTVLNNQNQNVCIPAGGSLNLSYVTVGTTQTGGVTVPPAEGFLRVDGGSTLAVSNALVVGYTTSGNVNVDGGYLTLPTLSVGYTGTGYMTVQNGGQLTLSGPNSYFAVGQAGTGYLEILNGGQVTAVGMTIGDQVTGLGSVGVGNGSGQSTLTVANNLNVGNGSTGTSFLGVFSGGTVAMTSDNASLGVGNLQGSNGGVLVDGGNLALSGQNFYLGVGGAGAGGMRVQNGGLVNLSGAGAVIALGTAQGGSGGVGINAGGTITLTGDNATVYIGAAAGATGSMTVDGGALNLSGQNSYLVLGQQGDGGLQIQNSGTVHTSNLVVGNAGNGYLSVTTAGVLNLTGVASTMGVGNATGSIGGVLVDGGLINAGGDNVWIGIGGAGHGNMTIQNGGELTMGGSAAVLTLGNAAGGSGGIGINAGGTVTLSGANANVYLGAASGATGSMTVDGGTLNVTGQNSNLVIGQQGNGGLLVENSGQVNASNLIVGNQGNGSLGVKSGGTITLSGATSSMNVGSLQGSSGSMLVDGGTTTLNGDQSWVGIGGAGNGYMTVQNGGQVNLSGATAAMGVGNAQGSSGGVSINAGGTISLTGDKASLGVGNLQGSNGAVLVDGGNLTLSGQNSYLAVGNAGNGSMTIQNAGQVTVASMAIGAQSGGNGTVTVNAGSSIAITNSLTVGNQGTGNLTVNADGTVSITGSSVQKTPGQIVIGADGTFTMNQGSHLVLFNGSFVNVGGGQFNDYGAIDVSLSNPLAAQALGLAGGGGVTSFFSGATIDLSLASALQNGDFFPLISSQSFNFGANPPLWPQWTKQGNGSYSMQYGNLTFMLPTWSGNFYLTPELVQTGSTEVFGLLAAPLTCAQIVDQAVHPVASGTNMNASFVPNFDLTLNQAAALCGVQGFAWQQTVIAMPSPNPFRAANAPNTELQAPFPDPPEGGYTGAGYVGLPIDNSYPFYCDPAGDPACLVSSNLMVFQDRPADPCLAGGLGIGCGGSTALPGLSMGFLTSLVTVVSNDVAGDSLFTWTWASNFNGTAGGTWQTKSYFPIDPGSGTGGVTLLSVNGVPVASAPEPSTLRLLSVAFFVFIAFQKRSRLAVFRRRF